MRCRRLFGLCCLFIITACRPTGLSQPSTGTAELSRAPTAVHTPIAAESGLTLESPFSAEPPTLTIWLPIDLAFPADSPAGQVLAAQLATFGSAHPDVNIEIYAKSLTGQGGILSYLTHGRAVAPDILPDVIAVSSENISQAAIGGLIYPLTNYFTADILSDIFPAAQSPAQVDGVLYGIPFSLLGLNHLAYNRGVLSEPLPTRWDDLVARPGAQLAFPVAGLEGAELVLQMYLGSGALLTDSAGHLHMNEGPLTKALTRLGVARSVGLIPFSTVAFSTLDEAWTAYRGGVVNMALVDSSQFLRERTQRSSSGFSALPGPEGPAPSLARSWLWAISTPDPAQQLLSAELISWLASTQNMGEWSLSALILPARRSALALWPGDDSYITFLREQAELARPFPAVIDRTVLGYLRDSVVSVATQSESAWNAARKFIAAVQQP